MKAPYKEKRAFLQLSVRIFLLLLSVWAGRRLEAGPGGDPLAVARDLRARGKLEEALVVLENVTRGGGPLAADAYFERGEILRALERWEEALDSYNQAIRLRPRLDLLQRTLERKYRLGLDFLQGNAKRSFLGLFSYSSPSFGVRILDELVQQFPYQSFSDDALYSIANHYFRNGQWEEAQAVYERLIDTYPRSEWVPPAYFQLGKAIYHQIKGYKYDPTPITKARWYFERFLEKQRVGPEAEEARRFVRKLRDMEARYELYVASFYILNGCPKGAKIHLRAALQKGRTPSGELVPAAKEAQRRLSELAGKRSGS